MVVVKQLPRQSGSSGDDGSSSRSGSNGGGSRSGNSGVGSGGRSSGDGGRCSSGGSGSSSSGSSVVVAELKHLLGNNQKLKVSEREELQFTHTKENLYNIKNKR